MVTARKSMKVGASKPASHGIASRRKKLPLTRQAKKEATEAALHMQDDHRDSKEANHRNEKQHDQEVETREGIPSSSDNDSHHGNAAAVQESSSSAPPKKKRAPAKNSRKATTTSTKAATSKRPTRKRTTKKDTDKDNNNKDNNGDDSEHMPFLSNETGGLAYANNSFDQRNDPQAMGEYHPLNEHLGPPSPIQHFMDHSDIITRAAAAAATTDPHPNATSKSADPAAESVAADISNINNIIGCDDMMMGVRQEEWDILNQDSFGFNLGHGTLSLSFSMDNGDNANGDGGVDGNEGSGGGGEGGGDVTMGLDEVNKHKHSVDLTNAVTESTDSHGIEDIKATTTQDTAELFQSYSYNHPTHSSSTMIPKTPPSTHSAPTSSYHHHHHQQQRRSRRSSRNHDGRKRHSSREGRDPHNSHDHHCHLSTRRDARVCDIELQGAQDNYEEGILGGSFIYDHRTKSNKFFPSPSNYLSSQLKKSSTTQRSRGRDRGSSGGDTRTKRNVVGKHITSSNRQYLYRHNNDGSGSSSPPALPDIEHIPSPIGSWNGGSRDAAAGATTRSGHEEKRYKSNRAGGGSGSGRDRSSSRERSRHPTTISMSRSHPQPPPPHQYSSVVSNGRAASWAASVAAAGGKGSGPHRPHARYPNGSPSDGNRHDGSTSPHYYTPPPHHHHHHHHHPHAAYPPYHAPPPPGAPHPSQQPPLPPGAYPYRPHPHHRMHPPGATPPEAPAQVPPLQPLPSNGNSNKDAFLPPPPPPSHCAPPSNAEPPREVYIRPSSSSSGPNNKPPPPSQYHPHHPPPPTSHPGALPVLHNPHGPPPPTHHSPHLSPYPPPHPYHSQHGPPPPHHHPGHHNHRHQPPIPPLQLSGAALLQSHNGGPPLTREQAPGIGWPAEEDVILTDVMANHKSPVDWDVIAREHGRGRSARECHDRWTRYLKPGARKGQWKEEEDAIVLRVIAASSEQPFTQWADLAPLLRGRSGKQIRDRWVNYLNPAINHMPFSREDDLRLWEGHKELGKRWVEISVKVFDSTRSENHIKNRWYSAAFKKFIASEFGPNAYVDALAAPAPSTSSVVDVKASSKMEV